MAASSINTGLASVPDLTGVNNSQIDFHIIQLYNAVDILAQATDAYTGNVPQSSGQDQPEGGTYGPAVQGYIITSVALTPGALVGIDGTSGQLVNADSTLGTPILARGICTSTSNPGDQASVLLFGVLPTFAAGTFTPGDTYYLGAGGLFIHTRPITGVEQAVGYALTATSFFFNSDLSSRPAPVTT